MSKELSGKVALVTGGSRGIGAATARALAEKGADVAISYSASPDKAEAVVGDLTKKGVRAAAFKADQANLAEVERLVASVVERFGRLDILVNNAGVFIAAAPDDPSVDPAQLERQFAVNVRGVATAVRAAAKVMDTGSRIISVGSVLGARVPFAGLADYSATKAAVATYTKGWARDLGPKGITVNAIQPGPINTDMNPDDADFAAPQKAATALGRYGRPEEVAAAIVFLASPEASYITGTTLDVDGGFNA
ncbi:MAG TPA: SDR family oxidoreductase [Pirellulales bacterium]|nr:SDR family oxidoreductase [Pirellulales bacterium]